MHNSGHRRETALALCAEGFGVIYAAEGGIVAMRPKCGDSACYSYIRPSMEVLFRRRFRMTFARGRNVGATFPMSTIEHGRLNVRTLNIRGNLLVRLRSAGYAYARRANTTSRMYDPCPCRIGPMIVHTRSTIESRRSATNPEIERVAFQPNRSHGEDFVKLW